MMESFIESSKDSWLRLGVEFGNKKDFNSGRVGTGGSEMRIANSIPASIERNLLHGNMTRIAPTTNSSFVLSPHPTDNQYAIWGKVIKGMEFVDNIKLGSSSNNGSVKDPDYMKKVVVGSSEKSDKRIGSSLSHKRGGNLPALHVIQSHEKLFVPSFLDKLR